MPLSAILFHIAISIWVFFLHVMLATTLCLCDSCVGNLVIMSRALNMHHPHDPNHQSIVAA